ncbi:putative D-lactate dehydrogenase [Bradyrhizobium sp. ORS 375]|uniref:FAD-binding oxidoreductase n=1 Tax=Bradyrhizobium sp. (strain ORS 375) TaxID=566679 RepID=UPI00024064DC|nr:FAD-binding oxidoreductase [Bradyrhizobium sp. ORS 375]CCD96283.1 putative D-lactate dehydrogenase [Bradyrhizobium sp. ORS 375]
MTKLITTLQGLVGTSHVLTAPEDQASYLRDWLGKYHGAAIAVVRPGSTAEVAAAMTACAEARVAVVPQGGHTSLSGGATPDASGSAIVLSLSRMNRIRAVDPIGQTMVVDAGVVLTKVQETAREAGLFFPLSLGSEGSCTVGGNLAANAGGVAVLRYGVMRELTLGLEVVLPDGRIWDGLRALRKDNTGYALRDLFISSEGTLGIITGAVLKLFPQPTARATAFVAVADAAAALKLLQRSRARCGDRLTAFEFLTAATLEMITRQMPDARLPFPALPEAAVLIELSDIGKEAALTARLEVTLTDAMAEGLVSDAVVAQDGAQAKAFWRVRESVSEALVREGKALKHDISVPVAEIADFVAVMDAAVGAALPGIRPMVFGHLGDGNLHYNLMRPLDMSEDEFYRHGPRITRLVHDEITSRRGSISAEHGIGQLRTSEMPLCKPPLELELMLKIKQTLDPHGLMNPGKLLSGSLV